jgi:ethanolamine ammonia-lyase large subunit
VLGLKPAPEFGQWLMKQGIFDEQGNRSATASAGLLKEVSRLWIK